MKVVLAMVVRDEADVIEDQLAYHLSVGVDAVLVTDHRSVDGTSEILEDFARTGRVHVTREETERIRQGEWMTAMARRAATELRADWVLNGDADEFWWAGGLSLKSVLGAVPARYSVVHALSQSFLPVLDDDRPFAERMTLRLVQRASVNDPVGAYRLVTKAAHRADVRATVADGNHNVDGVHGDVLRGWYPLEILHFPLRTRAQCEHKYRKTWGGWEVNLRGDLTRAGESGRFEIMYDRVLVSETARAQGLAAGHLVTDTRLRDALRAVRGDGGIAHEPDGAGRNRELPLDVAVQAETETVRMQRSIDGLSQRLSRLESRPARIASAG